MANPDTALAKPANSEGCFAPELYDAVTDYCFGHADETKRRVVEEHLTACPVCRRQATKLTSAVEVLRFDRELMPPVAPTEVATSFGMSARLGESFGGHWWMAVVSSALYALLYVDAYWGEIGMQLERYASYALRATPIAFLLIFTTTFFALRLCHRRVLRGDQYSLALSLCLLIGAGLTAYGLTWILLPYLPINGTGKPQEAYFRWAAGFLSAGCCCLLIPYHFVLTMQRELSEGKHAMALRFLSGQKDAVLPRRAIYLNLRLVFVFLVIVGLSAWWALHNWFDMLPAGRDRTIIVIIELALWFHYHALAAGWLFWYHRMINELKRECLIAATFLADK